VLIDWKRAQTSRLTMLASTHERMVVLSGSVTVSAGSVYKEIKPGGFVLMPAARRHTLATTSGQTR